MSATSDLRAEEYLKQSGQFQLGALVTESSHPTTAHLSEVTRKEISAGLKLLFEVDDDVLNVYRRLAQTDRATELKQQVLQVLRDGGRMFFTGCGSTGRLSIQLVSIWRAFWQAQRARGGPLARAAAEYEIRALSVMAGGDFALIKAVEGFEDIAEFGKKQIGELGVSSDDVVFAITEGGETSFVIGTAWKGLEAGAKVFFVYNNPDELLCERVERSRELIRDPRPEKINLTTGPMAITGSTRMQATSIQLCVILTVLEMVARELMQQLDPGGPFALDSRQVPDEFLADLTELITNFKSANLRDNLANLVRLEETSYRSGHKHNYFADRFGIDVLTDTTERSPTYCTPPFRKFDDATASDSWAFLFVPAQETSHAWEQILKRTPRCVEWAESDIRTLVGTEKAPRFIEIARKIGCTELMRFRIGLDGLKFRKLVAGDSATAIVSEDEEDALWSPTGFFRVQLDAARSAGANIGLVYFGHQPALEEMNAFCETWAPDCVRALVPVPASSFLLGGALRVGAKMLLNALSTSIMVRLGRVMGNYMIWVVPSNLKLIDRSTRYIQRLTDRDYRAAALLLFEVIEYLEPRMKRDQAYPPAVAMAVTRARQGVGNEQAEQILARQ